MTLKKLALTLLLMTGMAAGQGFRWNGPQIVDSTGRPVPNASVRFCSEPTSNPTSCDTPVSIWSNRGLTSPLSNPTTADSHGNPGFYVLAGRYHAQITDPSISQIDIPDIILVQDGTYPQVNYTAVAYAATETFDASIGTIFALTLTGNVTSSTVSNPSLGRLIEFQICQDGTGGRTFAWPADFDSTPTMDARASKCRQSAWFYNGTKWKQFGQGGDSLGLPSGSQITNGAAVLTLPTTTDTLVGRSTTDTLLNKTLDTASGNVFKINGNTLAASAGSATITLPNSTDTLVGRDTTDTLTNKTITNPTVSTGTFTSPSLITPTIGSAGGTFAGATSGNIVLKATAIASGTLTLPAATDTLIGKATTDTLTNKTYDTAGAGNSFLINGLAAAANSGTGSVVRATSPTLTTPVISGTVTSYNGVATVLGGLGSEVATVDLTAQTAAVSTTTLYAVPANGQYRISWNAKITTAAGVSSTLGALTIVYTDPDGVVVTLTMPAAIAAGTIATTSTANTTGTVLEGLTLKLNCKTGTNITYAFAYVSNAANAMNYNLHISLEVL